MKYSLKRQVKQEMFTKTHFKGTGSVFRFTLVQLLKSKANIVSLVIMIVFALGFPAVSAIMSGARLKSSAPEQEEAAPVSEGEGQDLAADLASLAGISPEQLSILQSGHSTYTEPLASYLEEEEKSSDFESRYFLQLGYAIVIMMVSTMSASYIIRSVVEEKTSKLVEFLMISVRPLALLAGKILAVSVYVVGMLLVMFGCYQLSNHITGQIFQMPAGEMSYGISFSLTTLLSGIRIPELIVIAISFIFGILTFAILSGICGAGCSTTEDVNSANSLPMMIIMACYIISLIVSGFNGENTNLIVSICPILSIFCAPVQFMLGNVGIGIVAISWLLQAVVIYLMLFLAAKIYSDLLVYRGTRLKFSQIIKMAVSQKGGKA